MPQDMTAVRNRIHLLTANSQMLEEDKATLNKALDDHENLEAVRAQVGAFNWQGLITALAPLLSLFPGWGQIAALVPTVMPIINAILSLLNVKPLPTPVVPPPSNVIPTPGGGGTIVPTPMAEAQVFPDADKAVMDAPETPVVPEEPKAKKGK